MATSTTVPAQPVARKTSSKKASVKKSAPSKLAQAAAKGEVKLYRRRANGTMRRVPYLAAGTPERKAAEAVVARRESGDTIPVLCEDPKMSKATVRRMITGVLFAEAVETGQHDKAWDGKTEKVTVALVEPIA